MPRQNRVTPFGEIIATPARGTLMGNRGCLHNDRQQIIRHHRGKRWIICALQFKGRHRILMTPGRWTELFFLDEATALAAGHRPCAECSRSRFERFREFWAKANPQLAQGPKPRVAVIDDALHRERVDGARRKITYTGKLGALPDGSFVVLEDDQPYLLYRGFLLAWHPEALGYGRRRAAHGDSTVRVLTPQSVVKTLAKGYPVEIHPSAFHAFAPAIEVSASFYRS